jgi:hypothetical protein
LDSLGTGVAQTRVLREFGQGMEPVADERKRRKKDESDRAADGICIVRGARKRLLAPKVCRSFVTAARSLRYTAALVKDLTQNEDRNDGA